MNYRAAIFDLFGTLIDFLPVNLEAALLHIANTLGVEAEAFQKAEFAAFAEVGNSPFPDAIFRRTCEILSFQPRQEALDAAVNLWAGFTRNWLAPRSGVVIALRALRAHGIKTGLISNCDAHVPLVWPEIALAPLIDAPVFSSAESLKKPDRSIYELAAQRLDCLPQECLFIGDGSNRELTGAVAAGMAAAQFILDGEDADMGRWLERQEWDGPIFRRFSDIVEMMTSSLS
ncbi:MAG: HAD-IA family hydrolase [Chloroflexi bacterium]|nr:HAD-IA family hydrolase [Chloroflexota bacterium]